MVDVVRYAEKFENSAGTVTYTFPGDDYQYDASQPYRAALAQAVGADYAHDYAGANPWQKEPAVESVRFTIWGSSGAAADTEFDTMVSELRSIGLGKLYQKDQAGNRRWCWAKLQGRPSYGTTATAFYNIAVTASFVRFSDWYDTTATTGTQTIDNQTESVTIANAGNATVRDMVIRIRANAHRGFVHPVIRNTTTGEGMAIARAADFAASEIRIDCGALTVEYSDDDGATYTDIYDAVTLGDQPGFFTLEPGNNAFVVTDGPLWPLLGLQSAFTPNFSFEYSFYGAYE